MLTGAVATGQLDLKSFQHPLVCCNWVFFNEIPSLCYSRVAKQSNHISGNHIVDVYLYRLLMDCPQNGAFIAGRLPFKTWR